MTLEKKAAPLVALIGRPNVGKSTLFNRLVGERRALVDDQPGVTRDRNYGVFDWDGRNWRLVDTGGFEPTTDDDVLQAMRIQTQRAALEADLIVFLLDGRAGVSPADHEVALALRRAKKPVIFAVNKIDELSQEDRALEFYELGAERLFPISAEHGHGLSELLDEIEAVMPGPRDSELEESEETEITPRVAVVGKPNVGKSTLINALLGEERLLVHDRPGTTRDAIDTKTVLGGRDYVLVDTAGMRRKSRIEDRLERFSVMRALTSVERCHLALLVIDATEGVVDQDAKIAQLAHERGRGLAIIFNKWDLVENKEARRLELDDQIKTQFPHVDYAPILTLSALTGLRAGKLPELLQGLWENYNRRVGTGELNRALERWTTAHPPPAPGHRPIKLNYVAQPSVRPPTFVFFANQPDKLPEHYLRYLQNQLRADFPFEGTPLRLVFRSKQGRKRRTKR